MLRGLAESSTQPFQNAVNLFKTTGPVSDFWSKLHTDQILKWVKSEHLTAAPQHAAAGPCSCRYSSSKHAGSEMGAMMA